MQFKVRIEGNRISPDIINQFEKENGILFPTTLKDFYIEHNGAEIEEGTINHDGDEYDVVSVIYPTVGNPTLKVLIDENRKYHNYKEGHVPFAADWGDDLYCWDEATGEIWIYFPDDDDPIPVANSMDAFLSSIVYQEEGKKVMDQKYLPLGSIVILEGGIQKMLIISRALNVNNGGKQYYFDYGAVPYPEGLVSDQMAYFNADAISRVVFEGYHDVDDEAMVDNIRRYIEANPDRLRGDPKNWQV